MVPEASSAAKAQFVEAIVDLKPVPVGDATTPEYVQAASVVPPHWHAPHAWIEPSDFRAANA
jgi:hypothetical protein